MKRSHRCRGREIVALGSGIALLACGGGAPASHTAHSAAIEARPAEAEPTHHGGVATTAEVGGLNEREAEQSFRASIDALQACVSDGVTRVEFLSGSIEFAVKVDATRRARQIWAAQSTLGERGTEKCMFDALRTQSWPAPEGGEFGIARTSFEFEPRKGTPVPAVWDAGRVSEAVEALSTTLCECRAGNDARLLITLYIGDGGRAISGGASSDGPVDDQALDCVVDALLAVDYPAPERSPTKVRFQL